MCCINLKCLVWIVLPVVFDFEERKRNKEFFSPIKILLFLLFLYRSTKTMTKSFYYLPIVSTIYYIIEAQSRSQTDFSGTIKKRYEIISAANTKFSSTGKK